MATQPPADAETTRLARLQRSFANHKLGAAILASVAALGALGSAIDGGRAVAGLFGGGDSQAGRTPGRTQAALHFEPGELETATNERFAFTFRHPVTWEESGAFNSDGSTFTAPERGALLVAYGVNVADGPTDLVERVNFLAEQTKRNVLEERGEILDAGLRLGHWAGPGDELPAQRLVYRGRDRATGRDVTSVVVVTSQGGRDITIRCQAPTTRFSAYVGACNQLVATLRLARL